MNFLAMRNSLLAILLLCAMQTYAQIMPTYSDVDYVGDEIKKHLLDIYIPPNEKDPRPAVVYIHGGGWENGEKQGELRNELQKIYNVAKYIVVDINYRYSTDSIWPAQLYDCKTAIRYLRHNAELYNIDTCAIGVMGHSAGGHLAAILGTTNGIDSLEGYHLGYPNSSSSVQAVIDFFGPTDFLKADAHYPVVPPDSCIETVTYDDPDSFLSQLLGCQISTCPKMVASANPITYVRKNIPTDFIVVQNAVHADNIFYNTPAVNGLTNFFIEHLSLVACFQPPITNNDTISENTFNLVPNPAEDTIFLNFHIQATPQHIQIINMKGQIMSTQNDSRIDITDLAVGTYFVRVVFRDGVITKRFVKV